MEPVYIIITFQMLEGVFQTRALSRFLALINQTWASRVTVPRVTQAVTQQSFKETLTACSANAKAGPKRETIVKREE